MDLYPSLIGRLMVPAVLLLVAGCSERLSATDCIAHWNEGGPIADVAAEGHLVAEIDAGENKAGQWGCGLLFHSDRGEPWRFYGTLVNEDGGVVGSWYSQGGASWKTDSPEGPIEATVPVRSDGRLVVKE